MVWLREHLPPETVILCNGAGNFAAWIQPLLPHPPASATTPRRPSGSMGYGVPAAVAMQLLHPDATVVCFTGDGDFLMNGQEFATAVQYGLPIVVIVCDNGLYGTIRMHQEREYPGRPARPCCATPISPPMPAPSAASAPRSKRRPTSPAAYAAARASGLPSILHLKIDPDAILPGTTLRAISAKARTARSDTV